MIAGILSLLSSAFCLTSYIEKSNVFPAPFSPEEERACFERFASGDHAARDDLVSHNMRLVVHVAKKYVEALDPSDMISIGSIGLLKAIHTFRYDRGTQFATYAARCVENEILMAIRANKKHKVCVSLTQTIGADKDGNEITLMETIEAPDGDVSEIVERKESDRELREIVRNVLTDREYKIICYRYGLEGEDILPQREIAKRLGISRSYISRIESKVLEKLKAYLIENSIFL